MSFEKKNNIEKIITNPFLIFKVDNFFDEKFYNDLKKLLELEINDLTISPSGKMSKPVYVNTTKEARLAYKDPELQEIFDKFCNIVFSRDFFYYWVKQIYFPHLMNNHNSLRILKYIRYPKPIIPGFKSSLDFLFSSISTNFSFSYIKNKGGIFPHVDSIRKYLSLMIYFPDDNANDIEYGTTFYKSNVKNYTNYHVDELSKITEFKKNSKLIYKTPFEANCVYGFLRNNVSWHTVKPLDVSPEYMRKSININFLYEN